ncbi:GNAT family N-acetyltransferase [Bacillus thuringiensis]|uniref:GNAT family N-acetyltransferase n=1 Tax=Bacillus thuringiensis TaxID=1428 RepID=UPI0008CC3062|nr:GNAT family N-acetyltransferase [Bacillus thuringiensis]MCU4819528.1 GNAT family N-acetyltransferase [Bacillus cereus]MCU5120712.1 GNAT family N-acetyltransferase [Bacillus cereus]MCU5634563.1 GNAT family N-acetyltransferase [Bacillus cereus]SEJ74341.1 Acetyltransferase (GNAT) domain-containing protein [Bacillus thuringiensis]HDR7163712.1 GNAT family N-acetyltransferase [Bacillus cereus]
MSCTLSKIQGERIVLREFTETDWIGVHQYASQELACQYQPWGPNTVEESQSYVKEIIKDTQKEPRTRFAFAVIKDNRGSTTSLSS